MLEDNQVCWHAGDGANGTGNNTSIEIEICVNSIAKFPKACANAAWLTAELLKKHKLPVERVIGVAKTALRRFAEENGA